MQRLTQNLNLDWLYYTYDIRSVSTSGPDPLPPVRVSLPHTNVELPYHNFSEKEFAFVSWYCKTLKIPASLRGRRLFLDFDGVMTAATLYVNGHAAGSEHRGGFTPFSYEITALVHFGEDNLIEVRVDSSERSDIPPFGGMVDFLTFGGIYREVHLRAVAPVYICNLFAKPGNALSPQKRLDVDVRLANTTDRAQTHNLTIALCRMSGEVLHTQRRSVALPAQAETTVTLALESLSNIELWDIDQPTLYQVRATLDQGDALSTRIGFRQAEFRDDGVFYLNGRPLKLRGLNRHQTFPYIGAAAPARLQRKDAEILKYDLACNIVRTSHYPQSPHFLDRCDELGLLVLEEIPGWQHIGDRAWQDLSVRDVEAMIVRDRNHPSIILWGVRINESPDHHDFYVRTNALARQLDPTRPTGGIRCIWNSELLEDVYTMNDFGYDLKSPEAARYLNTEFCGHMFPTKSFDSEERVIQHALRHARTHNLIGGLKSAGGIGWCAFDYNTHAGFGSGDRICYHGVMDIFRQPKIAAHFYASQISPAQRLVLEPATYWKMGDRNGDSPEHLVVFSNVERIEAYVGSEYRATALPDCAQYPHLEHPPFIFSGLGSLWGSHWKSLQLIGYIGDRAVIEHLVADDGIPARLRLMADDIELLADGADMTRLSLSITDAHGNFLPYASQPVTVTIQGPAQLVGDNPFPMPAGRGALYLRTTRRAGRVVVTASTPRLATQQLTITIRSLTKPRAAHPARIPSRELISVPV
ncbi:MAG: hypothetical protein B9S32_00080 [Verrucomicrobia bacterium Tous-C9LFEB]|nr:MAG: hypothetical protein B9S32_00080 [Verrucomicrobia bacterium Tous-C9LFEB]